MQSITSIVRALSIALLVAPALLVYQRQPAGPPSNALSIEAESLVGSAQPNQGQVVVQNMQGFGSGWSGGAQLFWGGAQSGARLGLSFPTTVTGRYEIFLHFTRGPDFAVVRASLDGATPVTFNGYAATVSRDRALLGMRDLTPGAHQLRLEVTMKDGKSSGFNVGLDRIELQPVLNQGRNPGGGEGQVANPARGSTTIPILQIPAGSRTRDNSVRQTIGPLPMSARVELVQKTLSSTSTPMGQPGAPMRLSAAAPTFGGKSGIYVSYPSSSVETRWGYDFVNVPVGGVIGFNFEPVAVGRPHLLDCGWILVQGGHVLLTMRIKPDKPGQTDVILGTFPISGAQRLLAVIVPSQSYLYLWQRLSPEKSGDFEYCELTPFN